MRKILILYVNNGDIKNVSKRELMWKKVLEWINEEEPKNKLVRKSEDGFSRKTAVFDDGTTVKMIPIGSRIDSYATHVFVSDEIHNLQNGYEYVEKYLLPRIVSECSNYKNTMTRLFVFKVNDDNEIELENLKFDRNKK